MQQKRTLSKREKNLIIGVACVAALLVVGQFVILPYYEESNNLSETYAEVSFERDEIVFALSALQNIREGHEMALEKDAEIRETYLSESLSNEIGRMLTILCLAHNLFPTQQALSPHVTFEDENFAEITVFRVVTAAMQVRGEYEDIKWLIDSVREIPYIRISRVGFSFQDAPGFSEFVYGPDPAAEGAEGEEVELEEGEELEMPVFDFSELVTTVGIEITFEVSMIGELDVYSLYTAASVEY